MSEIHLTVHPMFLLFITMFFVLTVFPTTPPSEEKQGRSGKPPYKCADVTVDARVSDLLNRMTLEEKEAQ